VVSLWIDPFIHKTVVCQLGSPSSGLAERCSTDDACKETEMPTKECPELLVPSKEGNEILLCSDDSFPQPALRASRELWEPRWIHGW
jgi:hypothetical protein